MDLIAPPKEVLAAMPASLDRASTSIAEYTVQDGDTIEGFTFS